MLLTLTTTHEPATDLGYLLAKNPSRVQSYALSFGRAHVYYPEASSARCTAALLVDIDPLELVVRARRAGNEGALTQYVNDRPYAASSFLSVAISSVLGSALGGRSKERPELAGTPIALAATVTPLPAGAAGLIRRLFEPLGYDVEIETAPAAQSAIDEGAGHCALTLRGIKRLGELLRHLYVLIPVLDDDKHYWVGDDEVEKLLAKGEGWLDTHPERELIATRYLKRQRSLAAQAIARLGAEDAVDPDEGETRGAAQEAQLEAAPRLDDLRMAAVIAALVQAGSSRVADVGCGEGKLVRALLGDRRFAHVLGLDVSSRALEHAARRLHLDRLPEAQAKRVSLLQGSVVYRDARLREFDAICAIEVVEHIDATRLAAFEDAIFRAAAPATVIVTTPNIEYNARFATLPAGKLRHNDHRFEWTRAEFRAWCEGVAARCGYAAHLSGIGEDDPELGAPTQMCVFSREVSR